MWGNGRCSLRSTGRPPSMPHRRCYRLVLLSFLALIKAAASATILPFRLNASFRPLFLNSESSSPPGSVRYSPCQVSVSMVFSASSLHHSFATFVPSAAVEKRRCTPSLSVAHWPYVEKRYYCQISPPFADTKLLLDGFRNFNSRGRTSQGHMRKLITTWNLPGEWLIQYISQLPAPLSCYQRYEKPPGVSHSKQRAVKGRDTTDSSTVCNYDGLQELRSGYKCSSMHPLSSSAGRRAAFFVARYAQVPCIPTVQRLGTTIASAASRSPLCRPCEVKPPFQPKLLSWVYEALTSCEREALLRGKDSVPLRAVSCTAVTTGGSSVRGGFQRMLTCGRDKCKTPRLSVTEQVKWKTLPDATREQALRTPFNGATQRTPIESSTDVDSVQKVHGEPSVENADRIFLPIGVVYPAGGSRGASEQPHVGSLDKVLLGEKRGRLTLTLSNNHVHACVVDNRMQTTYAYASSFDRCLLPEIGAVQRRRGLNPRPHGGTMKAAWAVGRLVAQRALAKGIKKVFFDRKAYRYIGRVKALADGAREGGLDF